MVRPAGSSSGARPRGRGVRRRRCAELVTSSVRRAGNSKENHPMANSTPPKATICLWYDGDAEAAAKFYAQTFPNSRVRGVQRAPSDYPDGKEGDVLVVEFTVLGIDCIGLNGGPQFKHDE